MARGKTAFAREFLPNEAACPIFVNADLIAAGLSPFAPEAAVVRAGRIMLEQIAEHASTNPWSMNGRCTTIQAPNLSFLIGEKAMNPKPIEQAKTPDLAKSMPALRRAAQKARELARQTGTEAPLSNQAPGSDATRRNPA